MKRDYRCGAKKKKKPNPTNWQFSKMVNCQALAKEKLPDCVNLKPKFPRIIYQQNCGNCTANAVLAIDAYYHHPPSTFWVPSTIFCYHNQLIFDKEPTNEDCGSYIETALDVTRKLGVCNYKVWGNDKPFKTKPSKEAYADGLKGKEVTKYYHIVSLLQLKKALASGYPVAASLDWCWKSYHYDRDILPHVKKAEIGAKCIGGHAVVVVGYNDKKELLEVRNSWGASWCNGGYAYIAYKTFLNVIDWSDTYAVRG